jgi:hypothetical protein
MSNISRNPLITVPIRDASFMTLLPPDCPESQKKSPYERSWGKGLVIHAPIKKEMIKSRSICPGLHGQNLLMVYLTDGEMARIARYSLMGDLSVCHVHAVHPY